MHFEKRKCAVTKPTTSDFMFRKFAAFIYFHKSIWPGCSSARRECVCVCGHAFFRSKNKLVFSLGPSPHDRIGKNENPAESECTARTSHRVRG